MQDLWDKRGCLSLISKYIVISHFSLSVSQSYLKVFNLKNVRYFNLFVFYFSMFYVKLG